MMMKNYKYILALCLLLTLIISGCDARNAMNDKGTGSSDTKIYSPVDTDEQLAEGSKDGADGDTANEPTQDTDELIEVTSKPTEDTQDAQDTKNGELPEASEDTSAPEDSFTDGGNVTKPSEVGEPLSIGEALLNGEIVRGNLISSQSEKLKLTVNYICKLNADGSVFFDFEVGLECYDINCGARIDGGKLTVNGETYTFSTDPVIHEERAVVYIPFGSYTCELSADETICNIEASWFFNGVYAGQEIDTLEVVGALEWTEAD